jgi:hypothetical protein
MQLRTGDVLLFAGASPWWWPLDAAIRLVTRSPLTHVALVVVDPPFAPPGAYAWEAAFRAAPDAEFAPAGRCGVRLTRLADLASERGRVWVRRCARAVDAAALAAVHAKVYGAPYDARPSDWALAAARLDLAPQKTDRFWCSAFVAFALVELGWLDPATDWSVARPADLSSHSAGAFLRWTAAGCYGPDEPLAAGALAALAAAEPAGAL